MDNPITITVRRATPDDADAVARIFGGPKAIWGTLQLPYPDAEKNRKRYAEPGEGNYYLVACAGDEVVGITGLNVPANPRRKHTASLGMAARDDWHGRGVGTALMQAVVDMADNWLNIERLALEVYTDNPAAIRLYQKFGFVVEGTLKRDAFRAGQYVDAFVMARLRRTM